MLFGGGSSVGCNNEIAMHYSESGPKCRGICFTPSEDQCIIAVEYNVAILGAKALLYNKGLENPQIVNSDATPASSVFIFTFVETEFWRYQKV